MKAEYKLGEGVPIEGIENFLNVTMPEEYPDYILQQVLVLTQESEPVPGEDNDAPRFFQAVFPLMSRLVE